MDACEFTGERVIPEKDRSKEKYYGHLIFYDFASKFVKSKVVLDDGCGTGYGSFFVLKAQPNEVIGIDISVDAIAYAKKKYRQPRLTFLVGDGTNLPFADETFHVVISSQVVEHIVGYETYIREIVRILKNDGILLISTPNKQTFNPYGPPMPFHFKEFQIHEFIKLMRKFFKCIEVFGQYNIKKSTPRVIRNLLICLGQSRLFSWVPFDIRIKVGRAVINMFSVIEKYSLEDFRIQAFDPLTSMNIICICSMKI